MDEINCGGQRSHQKGYKKLVAETEKEIETLSTQDALQLYGSVEVVFVDLRDVREHKREGYIPGVFYFLGGCWSSGLIPNAPTLRDIFASGKKIRNLLQSGLALGSGSKGVPGYGSNASMLHW